jgi:hypothetical protein
MTWEFMGSNGKLWIAMGISCADKGQKTGFCGAKAASHATG